MSNSKSETAYAQFRKAFAGAASSGARTGAEVAAARDEITALRTASAALVAALEEEADAAEARVQNAAMTASDLRSQEWKETAAAFNQLLSAVPPTGDRGGIRFALVAAAAQWRAATGAAEAEVLGEASQLVSRYGMEVLRYQVGHHLPFHGQVRDLLRELDRRRPAAAVARMAVAVGGKRGDGEGLVRYVASRLEEADQLLREVPASSSTPKHEEGRRAVGWALRWLRGEDLFGAGGGFEWAVQVIYPAMHAAEVERARAAAAKEAAYKSESEASRAALGPAATAAREHEKMQELVESEALVEAGLKEPEPKPDPRVKKKREPSEVERRREDLKHFSD